MSNLCDKTSTLLVEHLEQELKDGDRSEEDKRGIENIIRKAKLYIYDDFNSSWEFPKNILIDHLKLVKLDNLAKNVIKGIYD